MGLPLHEELQKEYVALTILPSLPILPIFPLGREGGAFSPFGRSRQRMKCSLFGINASIMMRGHQHARARPPWECDPEAVVFREAEFDHAVGVREANVTCHGTMGLLER
jgi:hypothetical protein